MIQWKEIPGFEGRYMASNTGEIMSAKRKVNSRNGLRTLPSCVLKQSSTENGYKRVSATDANNKKNHLVHRLIALAFLENPENKPWVNHKDGNKANFSLENLEWCSHAENMRHAKNTGLWTKEMGREKYGPRNKIILKLHELGVDRTIISEAFGMNKPAISKVIREG